MMVRLAALSLFLVVGTAYASEQVRWIRARLGISRIDTQWRGAALIGREAALMLLWPAQNFLNPPPVPENSFLIVTFGYFW